MLISHGMRKQLAERVRRLFGANPARIQVAALPWRPAGGGVEVLLVTSRGTGRWVLPKGWPEGDEALHAAALREAAEEAGVDGRISRDPCGSYFYGKTAASGLTRRCEVAVFPLAVAHEADSWPEKAVRERVWLAPAEAARRVAEPDLGELIAGFSPEPHRSAA
ncbi:NUDIX hydrolase [Aquibium sp. A9E412]|uniref:NUDIX hydrolase n=1 Tax=Aquibium sp. A9E412 TaxID=2976767 RepID=UPI0025B104F0|nr:NUDIX hydrolase [Aquibium sp. A9E412]MDN2565973.1 NUDIX hydrolase [Aquibium sp. A9E412]